MFVCEIRMLLFITWFHLFFQLLIFSTQFLNFQSELLVRFGSIVQLLTKHVVHVLQARAPTKEWQILSSTLKLHISLFCILSLSNFNRSGSSTVLVSGSFSIWNVLLTVTRSLHQRLINECRKKKNLCCSCSNWINEFSRSFPCSSSVSFNFASFSRSESSASCNCRIPAKQQLWNGARNKGRWLQMESLTNHPWI